MTAQRTFTVRTEPSAALDFSRVSHLCERRAIRALQDKKWAINDERCEQLKTLFARQREAYVKLQAEYQAAHERFNALTADLDQLIEEASKPFTERMLAVQAEIGKVAETIEDGEIKWNGSDPLADVQACAASDLPLLDTDRVWRSADSGLALMALLPPILDPVEGEEEDAEEDEAAA